MTTNNLGPVSKRGTKCIASTQLHLIIIFVTGFLKGLAIELNIEQDEYLGELTEEAGIRVDISEQGEMPFPLEKGMSLAPGYATMIGLQRV